MRNGRSIKFQKSKKQKNVQIIKRISNVSHYIKMRKIHISKIRLYPSLSDHPKPDHPKPDHPKPDHPKPFHQNVSFNQYDVLTNSSDIANATLSKFKMLKKFISMKCFDAETHSRIDIYTIDSANGRSIILPPIILFQVLCNSVQFELL
jgi:hypothetical protein